MSLNLNFIETCIGLMAKTPDQLIALKLKLEDERDTAITAIDMVNEALKEAANAE